jgi:hypothetical protein
MTHLRNKIDILELQINQQIKQLYISEIPTEYSKPNRLLLLVLSNIGAMMLAMIGVATASQWRAWQKNSTPSLI